MAKSKRGPRPIRTGSWQKIRRIIILRKRNYKESSQDILQRQADELIEVVVSFGFFDERDFDLLKTNPVTFF